MSMKQDIAQILRTEASTAEPGFEATPNQINFLAILLLKYHKVWTDEGLKSLRSQRDANPSLTKSRAGEEISFLKRQLEPTK